MHHDGIQTGKAGKGKKVRDGRNEDVRFSMEAADEDDLEALCRAEAADRRQEERRE